MATPSYVGAGTFNGSSSFPSITFTPPAGTVSGDLHILLVRSKNELVATPSGWSVAPSSPAVLGAAGVSTSVGTYVFYQFQVGGTGPSAPVTNPGSGFLGRIYAFRGVDSTTPFDTSAAFTQATGSNGAAFGGVTTSVNDVLLAYFSAGSTTSNSPTPTLSNPNLSNITLRGVGTAGTLGNLTAFTAEFATAGITGGSLLIMGGNSSFGIITLALVPRPGVSFPCDSGAYSFTGRDAALRATFKTVASAGSYSQTGQTAVFARGRGVPADAGSYSQTGQAATFNSGKNLQANTGTYALAGQDATLAKRGTVIQANGGSYSLSGQVVTFKQNYALAAGTGRYGGGGTVAYAFFS